MDRECIAIQEDLVEAGGRLDKLDLAARQHVDGCPACAECAEQENRLQCVLESAVPPADEELQSSILAATASIRRKRAAMAALPAAASLLMVVTGALMLGSVPGLSILQHFPRWTGQSWTTLASALADWQLALGAAAASAATHLSTGAIVGALMLGLSGAAGLSYLIRRWRRPRKQES